MPRPSTILVVEDDPVIARSIQRELAIRATKCEVVTSAAEAAAVAGRYSVAILDIHLPDGNGLDVFRGLLTDKVVSTGVFFSATTDEADKRRAAELGVFVAKSNGVAAAVSTALQRPVSVAPQSQTRPGPASTTAPFEQEEQRTGSGPK